MPTWIMVCLRMPPNVSSDNRKKLIALLDSNMAISQCDAIHIQVYFMIENHTSIIVIQSYH